MRDALNAARTKLINNVRGWLRADGRRPKSGHTASFASRVRALLGAQMPSHVERQLVAIDTLTQQIRLADREVAAIAKADSTCRRLMTVPGVGPVTALRFVAARAAS